MAKTYVLILGAVFVLIGALGFVDGLTPDGELLSLFAVDTTQNLIYLVSGVVAMVAVAMGNSYARLYAQVFGVVYGLVTVLGFMDPDVLGLITVNTEDNLLHLAITLSALYVGFMPEGKTSRA